MRKLELELKAAGEVLLTDRLRQECLEREAHGRDMGYFHTAEILALLDRLQVAENEALRLPPPEACLHLEGTYVKPHNDLANWCRDCHALVGYSGPK